MSIIVNVDVMMAKRKMSSQELAEAICKALDCQPGDILEYRED